MLLIVLDMVLPRSGDASHRRRLRMVRLYTSPAADAVRPPGRLLILLLRAPLQSMLLLWM